MAVLIQKKIIDETLANELSDGKRLLDPLKTFAGNNNIPVNILEIKNINSDAEAHKKTTDLFYCLVGEIKFICGGEMIEPWVKEKDGIPNENELGGKDIIGGNEYVLTPGDWFYIPAGEPHKQICSDFARLIIIKIPQL